MASKKQKKTKGQTFSLQEFNASVEAKGPSGGQNVVYASKQPTTKSWADEVDDDDFADMVIANKMKMLLPSAPRASRGPDFNEADIPHDPPFTAHMGNISFDIDESDVYSFFKELQVTELRLPRDLNNRLRGFGYVQFKTRADLIEALGMNEQMLNGRPVRINLGQSQGEDRRGGSRNAPDQTPEDWRSAPPTQLTGPTRPSDYDRPDFRGGRSDNYGADFGSRGGDFGRRPYGGGRYDNEGGAEYGGSRGGDFGGRRDYGDRGRNFPRDREGFGRDGGGSGGGSEEEEATTWRRPAVARVEPEEDRSFRSRDRAGGSRDGRYGSRSREMSPDFSDVRSQRPPAPPRQEPEGRKASPPRERKKLVIAPRTVTQSPSDSVVANAAIFGDARPVDTAAREREIERKLAEQEEQRRANDSVPKSECAQPPPSNPWKDRRDREEIRSEAEEVTVPEEDGGEDGQSSRDQAQSPHPDSDHKDTNSEPEDERDLRSQAEEGDDFQRVERRGRKPKPSLQPTSRPTQRGRGGHFTRPPTTPANRSNF